MPRGSKDSGGTKEFQFLGFRRDHEALEQLERKNLSKTGIFYDFRHFLRGFWVPVALKLHGRI